MLVKNQFIKIRWVNANKNWFINKGYTFTKMWDYFDVKAEDLMPTSKYDVLVTCDYCGKEYNCAFGEYNTSIQKQGKVACYDCRFEKINKTYMNNLGEDRYNSIKSRCEELNYILISKMKDITTVCMNMEFICPIHGKQTLHIDTFLHGAICKCCAREKNLDTRKVLIQKNLEKEISQFNNNKLLNKEDYINSESDNLIISCGKCKHVFITSRRKYIKNTKRNSNYMCPNCNIELLKENLLKNKNEVEEYVNSINNNILLNKEDYIGNNVRNLKIQCGGCGEIFIASLSGYQSGKIMCDTCSSKISHGELAIKKVLDEYHIDYVREYRFNDCRDKGSLPFDFYLNEYNVCIEYQGGQHYMPVKWFGGQKGFESRQYHDNLKREYCHNNNIILIEIPYWQYKNIENILKEKLGLHKPNVNCA